MYVCLHTCILCMYVCLHTCILSHRYFWQPPVCKYVCLVCEHPCTHWCCPKSRHVCRSQSYSFLLHFKTRVRHPRWQYMSHICMCCFATKNISSNHLDASLVHAQIYTHASTQTHRHRHTQLYLSKAQQLLSILVPHPTEMFQFIFKPVVCEDDISDGGLRLLRCN